MLGKVRPSVEYSTDIVFSPLAVMKRSGSNPSTARGNWRTVTDTKEQTVIHMGLRLKVQNRTWRRSTDHATREPMFYFQNCTENSKENYWYLNFRANSFKLALQEICESQWGEFARCYYGLKGEVIERATTISQHRNWFKSFNSHLFTKIEILREKNQIQLWKFRKANKVIKTV